MSNLSPNEHSKDKKRSFFVRLFNFASHTMKSNKKSIISKKKFKKSSDTNIISTGLKIENDEIETCTFCDYCDKEIVAKFTGQNFICHKSCRKDNITTLNSGSLSEYSSLKDSNDFMSSRTYESDLGDSGVTIRRSLSSSLRNLSIPYADDTTFNSSSISSYQYNRNRTNSTMKTNLFLTSNVDTYTFSTVDLSTIKQYGISIKKLPSIRIKNHQIKTGITKEKEVISMPNDPYDSLELPKDLTNLIKIFNDNDQGLFIEETNDVIMGKVRVYINLLRPIKMLLTARPPSMLDQYSETDKNKSTIQRAYYNKEAIFWLPRGTTNVVYINVANTTTVDLISLLLSKFNIQNNPKKFALYEHTITSPTEVEVRKLAPDQYPSQIMLKWCLNGKEEYQKILKMKRFVLQENDPGSVEWDEFYVPELNSFLKILLQEEQDKRNQIIRRYEVLKKEIERCMSK